MADESLDILIRTQADTSGAQQATAALNQATGAQEKGGEAAEKHKKHVEGLHKMFHALNEVVPGLGTAMQAAFSPIGGAMAIGTMALQLFHEKMKEFNEECKRLEEEAAKPLTHRLEAMREGTVENAKAQGELTRALTEAARAEQTVADKAGTVLAAMKSQAQQADSLAEAQHQNELARLETRHQAGLLSDEQYNEKRLEAEERFLEQKRALEEKAALAELEAKRKLATRADLEQPALDAEARAAEFKSVKAQESLRSLPAEGEVTEKLEKAKKELADFRDKMGWRSPILEEGLKSDPSTWGTDQKKFSELTENLKRAQGLFDKFPQARAEREEAAAAAKAEADRRRNLAVENQSFTTKTNREIDLGQALWKSQHEVNQELNKTGRNTLATSELGAAGDGQLVTGAASAMWARDHGQRLTAVQASQIKGLHQYLRQNGKMTEDMARTFMREIEVAHDDMAKLWAEVKALRARVKQANVF
jgi:hypothetical protein